MSLAAAGARKTAFWGRELMGSTLEREVALVTPSHRNDLERFALLSDSIDRHLTRHARHYVIVNDDDLPIFARFSGPQRVVLPCSQFLPRWLRLAPPWLVGNGRRVWWSFRSRPVHGWHIQQLLKIAAGLQLPEPRFCFVDSDNVFIRPFDVGAYAGGEQTPLYLDREAITADAPLHAIWTRNCDHLLGQKKTDFPADDYIGNVIVWDKRALYDMTLAIERVTGKSWPHALCSTRAFSEYLLYGHFVSRSPRHLAKHRITADSLANAYWDEAPLDTAAVTAMVDTTSQSQVALCIESFSHTPVSIIRGAVGLSQARVEAGSCQERMTAAL
jgi:hypothetical protein